jgi:Ca2+-binding RTX toxin-like protein
MRRARAWVNRSLVLPLAAPLLITALLVVVQPAASGAPPGPKCTITGTSGNDVLYGTRGNDVVCGLGGNDVIYSDAGRDVIYGGAGKDRIDGGRGNDVVYGGRGNDRLAGRRGNDRLVGGARHDHLFGGKGRDALLGGRGDDTNIEGRILKSKRIFAVIVLPNYDVPTGTLVTWKPLGGTCVEGQASFSEKIEPPSKDRSFSAFFGITGNPWEACAYSRSNGWFRARFQTPAGSDWFRDVNVTQTSAPTIYFHTFLADCEGQAGNAICHGGSDTAVGQEAIRPPIKFGPLRDPEPPPSPPTLQCRGVAHFSIGDTLKDFHPCTSEGSPLPTLSFEGSTLPSSVTASRYPTPASSWIVLNGRFAKPGQYILKVNARVPGLGWERNDEAVIEVSG